MNPPTIRAPYKWGARLLFGLALLVWVTPPGWPLASLKNTGIPADQEQLYWDLLGYGYFLSWLVISVVREVAEWVIGVRR